MRRVSSARSRPRHALRVSVNQPTRRDRALPACPGIASEATTLRIAFGSCYKEYARTDLRIFDAIAAQAPDLFLLLGDTCYTDEADRQSEATMMAAHLRNRNHDRLRALIASVPSLGIWDDHDFGPNDSDGRYTEAERSLRCFVRMWAQRSYGQPTLPGVFSRVVVGPVELFLLDSRFYRRTHQHVLGDAQLDWLMDGLRQSRAPIKLLLSARSSCRKWQRSTAGTGSASDAMAHASSRRCSTSWRKRESPAWSRSAAIRTWPALLFAGDPAHRWPAGPAAVGADQQPDRQPSLASPVWPADSQDEHAFDHYLLREVAAANFGLLDVDLSRAGAELRLSLHSETGEVFSAPTLRSTAWPCSQPGPTSAPRSATPSAPMFFGDQYARCSPPQVSQRPAIPRPSSTAGTACSAAGSAPSGAWMRCTSRGAARRTSSAAMATCATT